MSADLSPFWHRIDDEFKPALANAADQTPIKIGDLAKDLGLTVKAASLPIGISGEIRPHGPANYVIRVNRDDTKTRQRFTVAHEISHFLLHRHKIDDGLSDDVLYRSRLSSKLEREANQLAALILMPKSSIIIEAKNLGFTIPLDQDQSKHLSDLFKVSPDAMRIRLGEINFL